MPRSLGWIRQFHRPESPRSTPLLVFPHAGSGASAYRDFSRLLSGAYDVVVFQYPGRQDRAGEPTLGSLAEIAAGAFAEFAARHEGAPIVTFGHSMGGWVSFEFARIAEARGIEVRQLTVSASVAPCRAADKPPHPTDDQAILDHLGALGGTAAAVFGDPELMRLTLPVIKADYRACDAYSCAADVKVAAPIRVLGGAQDPIVTLGDLYGWAAHSDDVQVTLFDGGHFFLTEQLGAVAELLTAAARHEQTA